MKIIQALVSQETRTMLLKLKHIDKIPYQPGVSEPKNGKHSYIISPKWEKSLLKMSKKDNLNLTNKKYAVALNYIACNENLSMQYQKKNENTIKCLGYDFDPVVPMYIAVGGKDTEKLLELINEREIKFLVT